MITLWKIKLLTVVVTDDGVAHILLNADKSIPDVLRAFDRGILDQFLRDSDCTTEREGMQWVLHQRGFWSAPVSDWMQSAGKGVDTVVSAQDRNGEIARKELAKKGELTFYDRVLEGGLDLSLDRSPELFIKCPGKYMTGPDGKIGRRDAATVVKPEAEIVVVLAPDTLNIVGWALGNDQTVNHGGKRGNKIVPGESENPLMLSQAKIFEYCAGIGPCINLSKSYPAPNTRLTVQIMRGTEILCEQTMAFSDYIRDTQAVIDGWLKPAWGFMFRPEGGFLMLGTGTRIPDSASLLPGDWVMMQCPELFPTSFEQLVVDVS